MPTPQETHEEVIALKEQLNILPIIKKQMITSIKTSPINSNPMLTTSLNITQIINPQTQVLTNTISTNTISTPINPNSLLLDGLLSVPTSLIYSNSST